MGVISDGTTMLDSGEFENLPVVNWDTTAKTLNFTAVSGNGYFVNTTSGAITVTLPAGSAGNLIGFNDYKDTFATNNVILNPNGTDKINTINEPAALIETGMTVVLLYVDSTVGWKSLSNTDEIVQGNTFTTATGGTVTTSGDFKIHSFNSSGTFEITNAGTGPYRYIDYLVVAGGGGGGSTVGGGGGGAGGYRVSADTYTGPARAGSSLTASVASFPITVGAGGGGSTNITGAGGTPGNDSIFSTITSAGGGVGGDVSPAPGTAGDPGGSGGGSGSGITSTPVGNDPATTPVQGFAGGDAPSNNDGGQGAGGGGAGEVGRPGGGNQDGGDGDSNSITGSAVTRGGGGGGGARTDRPATGGTGGTGGGGNGSSGANIGGSGTANTGGGGGGGGFQPHTHRPAGAGGSGVVIIRYKFQ
jgi:hypothetical protein